MSLKQISDVLIIGSGLAGMTVALTLAQTRKVTLITKRDLQEGSSKLAQGGIAAVLNSSDSTEQHIHDTCIAGAGLCDPAATRLIIKHSKAVVDWLIELGVPFTKHDDEVEHYQGFHLTREGGHSRRRVIHVADATGFAMMDILSTKVRSHPNIQVFEQHIAVDLLSKRGGDKKMHACYGAYVYDLNANQVKTFLAPFTVLATGGAGKAYLYTTNPDVATGDGIAMGWRAGCRVANMEFIQFHPTCLYHPQAKSFLISEAVRGEGGILKRPDGTRFMQEYHEKGELAPRDIVARAIDYEMKKGGFDCVYLDISFQSADFIKMRFPTIFQRCFELGIDMTTMPIPVVPAVHFTCGGVVTDLEGQTDLPALYAVGEVAYTGFHGANRLASNSLLECLVLGKAAAQSILSQSPQSIPDIPEWDESRVTDPDEEVVISHNWAELRRFMWDYVGIVRTNKRLERALHRIHLLKEEINDYYSHFRISNDLIELRNLVLTAELIIRCAMLRKESRGLHWSRDYTECGPEPKNTILDPHLENRCTTVSS